MAGWWPPGFHPWSVPLPAGAGAGVPPPVVPVPALGAHPLPALARGGGRGIQTAGRAAARHPFNNYPHVAQAAHPGAGVPVSQLRQPSASISTAGGALNGHIVDINLALNFERVGVAYDHFSVRRYVIDGLSGFFAQLNSNWPRPGGGGHRGNSLQPVNHHSYRNRGFFYSDPAVAQPDFHLPAAFGQSWHNRHHVRVSMRIFSQSPADSAGAVMNPDDNYTGNWSPYAPALIGLNTRAAVTNFVDSAASTGSPSGETPDHYRGPVTGLDAANLVVQLRFFLPGAPPSTGVAHLGQHRLLPQSFISKHHSLCEVPDLGAEAPFCLARAFIMATASVRTRQRYRSEHRDRLERLAQERHQKWGFSLDEGVPLERGALTGIELDENVRFMIYAFSEEGNPESGLELKWSGNEASKLEGHTVIPLLKSGTHVDLIAKPLQFANRWSHGNRQNLIWCLGCGQFIPYLSHKRHQCEQRCKVCHLVHPLSLAEVEASVPRQHCADCGRELPEACFRFHQQVGLCQRSWYCPRCDLDFTYQQLTPEAHGPHCKLPDKFCRKCYSPFVHGEEHECSMHPLASQREKPANRRIICYDFETMVHGETHEVNFVVARYIDEDLTQPPSFVGDSLQSFMAWLLQLKPDRAPKKSRRKRAKPERPQAKFLHDRAILIAHNARGYDAHFIMRYVLEHEIEYRPIYRGTQIMGLYLLDERLPSLTLIDSLSHIPSSLASFTKTFGLDASRFKKGFYPYTFNRPEHKHYIGPLPELKYYLDPLRQSLTQMREITEWHEEERQRVGEHWDHAKELEAYCISDVDLLVAGLRVYRDTMLHVAGVDPLLELTAASVAMRAFRTIGLSAERRLIFPSLEHHQFIRSAYYGGMTEVFKASHEFGPEEEGRALDVTSLYPSVMYFYPYPEGPARWLRLGEEEFNWELHRGFAEVTVTCPPDLRIPILPVHTEEGRLVFDLQSPKRGVWSTAELKFAVQHGYSIQAWHRVLVWNDWSTEVFRDYVAQLFLLKTVAAGGVADEAEGRALLLKHAQHLQLGPERLERLLAPLGGLAACARTMQQSNAGLKTIAKLLLNSLYGKFAQRDFPKVEVVKTGEELAAILLDGKRQLRCARIMSENLVEVVTENVVSNVSVQQSQLKTLPQLAAMVTAYGRLTLMKKIFELGADHILYCDTDSVYYRCPRSAPSQAEENLLGLWENDLPAGARIVKEFVATGPKAYGYYLELKDGSLTERVKIKGFPGLAALKELFTVKNLKEHFAWRDESEEHKQTFELPRFFRNKTDFKINSGTASRSFRAVYHKREVLPDGDTLPFGYAVPHERCEQCREWLNPYAEESECQCFCN